MCEFCLEELDIEPNIVPPDPDELETEDIGD